MKILSDRMLRIKGSAGHSRCTDLHALLNNFGTGFFLRTESTAVQRCARKSTKFPSGSKIVGENWGEMENFLVTQDSTHRGFY